MSSTSAPNASESPEASASGASPAPATPPGVERRGRRGLAVAVALLLATLAGYGLWAGWGGGADMGPSLAPSVSTGTDGAPRSARAGALDRDILEQSLTLGRSFLLSNQLPDGRFRYELNLVTGEESRDDNPVRQAGTLWSLALLHAERPTRASGAALDRGLAYFRQHSRDGADGARYVVYPGEEHGKTGTIALLVLAHLEYWRALPAGPKRRAVRADLEAYLIHMLQCRTPGALFFGSYANADGRGMGKPSPYSDGEALLAMVKVERYLEDPDPMWDLQDRARESAEMMYAMHVLRALREHPDSNMTKGFYQWGSMAMYELHLSGWPMTDHFGPYVVRLAHWMIDAHAVLSKPRNTAYAYEGILHAYDMALRLGDKDAAAKFARVSRVGMRRLTTWQVGGPLVLENPYLRTRKRIEPLAVGGVMNGAADPMLRVDVTQHQMHACLLARRYLFGVPSRLAPATEGATPIQPPSPAPSHSASPAEGARP